MLKDMLEVHLLVELAGVWDKIVELVTQVVHLFSVLVNQQGQHPDLGPAVHLLVDLIIQYWAAVLE